MGAGNYLVNTSLTVEHQTFLGDEIWSNVGVLGYWGNGKKVKVSNQKKVENF